MLVETKIKTTLACIILGLTAYLSCTCASSEPHKDSFWNQSFLDIDGKKHVHASTSTITVVWIFILEDCPISNAYSPEINRLVDHYQTKGISFLLIHSNPSLNLKKAKKHRDDFQLTTPIVLDQHHSWVHYAGATITPQAVVFNREGQLKYRGRIDDRFPAFGKRRTRPTKTELRDALESVLNKKPITVWESKAVGCYIPALLKKSA